jgi:hypothetical protein
MPIGAALRGFGAILKGGKRSPTISSVKPSIHKTKKAQKDARMKEQFDKQKSRTLSDRKMGKKEMTLTEYANRRTKKADGGKATYKTKDGRTVKKGLYYYMNRAKKRGTSKPGKGSVTDKALRDSAKTAKKD